MQNKNKKIFPWHIIPGVVYYPSPMNTTSWPDFFSNTTGWLLGITVSVILLFLIIGGLVYITSAGQREKMELGKRIILTALIGFFVIILSVSIIVELRKIL